VKRFSRVGVDRLIASLVHVEQEDRLHTVERLAAIVGTSATN